MSTRIGTSGTYNVRDKEKAMEKPATPPAKLVRCVVFFLDDTQHAFEIDRRAKSQVLLECVYNHLELIEKDYFGLQIVDSVENGHQVMRWIDPSKSLRKQIKTDPPYQLHFRVKFYINDPCKLQEEYTRYHYFLQVKRDILDGKLVTPRPIALLLASYAVQSELGDYTPEECKAGYLTDFRFVPAQDADFASDVARLHQQHKSQTPADAELNYLNRAKHLEMYGVDLHHAKDSSLVEILLGVTGSGLVVFQNNVKINTFTWNKIVKISFKRKQFFIELRGDGNEMEDLTKIGFNMLTYRSCKTLWKSCVEHHSFFRLHHNKAQPRKWYQLGSKFRYSGRTEYETVQESKKLTRGDRFFERTPSKKGFSRHTIGGTNRQTIMNEHKRSSFNSNHLVGSQRSSYRVRNSYSAEGKWRNDDDDGGFLTMPALKRGSLSKRDSVSSHDMPNGIAKTMPREVNSYSTLGSGPHSSSVSLGLGKQTSSSYSDIPNESGFLDSHSLVTINIVPDEQGRFGFNVKGGADQRMPILVSRVAKGLPADLCVPRLNEGDQVLRINGRDVSNHTHQQVVMFIRAARETHTGHLTLDVRPNVYVGEEYKEPPPQVAAEFHYAPDTRRITARAPGLSPLQESLLLLQEALEGGAATAQFDQLYRRAPNLTNQAAKLPNNLGKNRYRDISPYDQTRVLLRASPGGGDYVNANYVNMEVPGAGIVNRYIAAQGPLPNTSGDFWQMVWEQQVSLVVMLTALVERGRVKCHQYWPHLYETADLGPLQLTCVKERETRAFAFREFTLVHAETGAERHIRQIQYIAWPDHGVPDDPADFLDFVIRVRQNRIGMVEPILVHCSAGIGRTGVLILMETAMCLIEANQPVFPLDIVRQMREQRAMLIQTSGQYRFVCDAILKVFHEKIVKPLDDFGREAPVAVAPPPAGVVRRSVIGMY